MRYSTGKSSAAISILLLFVLFVLATQFAQAQRLADFEGKMTEFTLDNGLKLLVLERHEVPVVSFHSYADVGSVDEVKGITGLAHLFEHMAFKGTKTIGTRDYKAEAEALAKVDRIFEAMKIERRKGGHADKARLDRLDAEFKEAQQEAQKYIVPDEYEETLTRAGSKGFNAYTSEDATQYIISLPSNKIELWMALESDRFLNPVLREFYKEKDVVMEERRMGENAPSNRLSEEFQAIAFKAHPYGEPVIGHMSDLETLTRTEAETFFKKYYSPQNLTIAIVGDVNPQQVKKLAQKYFAGIPGAPRPDPVETVEPPQLGERRIVIDDPSQPLLYIGYHRPDFNHSDNAIFDTIAEIIGIGRTSRLYKTLVKEKKMAVNAGAFSGGSKYPALFLFYAVPAKGRIPQECESAIYAEIEKLKAEPVLPEELQKAKTRSRADLISQLDSNSGLAAQLAFYQVITGDWRNLFGRLDKINKVTAEDIQRLAKECFVTKNRTVGIIQTAQSQTGP